jgi:glyceraldehyde-3-phosphate dehydrogenase/erythrose-4-phosphate dehydrogenase
MRHDKKVLVVGTGTIGEPLIGLLAHFKKDLGLDEVMFHKRTPLLPDRSKVRDLIQRGAHFVSDAERRADFQRIGLEPVATLDEALEQVRVVIDCTPAGNTMKQEIYNNYVSNVDLFIAQGSEFGFGKMYARGINDRALIHGEDRFVQVVSCNTHNLAVLVNTLGLSEGKDNLESGRFVCLRRCNDLSQDDKFIPSPEVGTHKDPRFGTHHARDAYHLFKTLGLELNLYSSAMKINTQFMHVLHFTIRVKKPTTLESLVERIRANDRIATTYKMTANAIFSFGRDHGFYGRIMNQTVIPTETLALTDGGREIVGFCFTPQDGNAILSSVAATEWALYPDEYEDRIQALKPYFFDEV